MKTGYLSVAGLFVIALACCKIHPDNESGYTFAGMRADYRLELTESGTRVVERSSGAETQVPFGEPMSFGGYTKYSKDTSDIIHHVRAHAETYRSWDEIAELPVDFLRTGEYTSWDNRAPRDCMMDPFSSPHRFPDQADKVTVAYVNMTEFTRIGNWDPAFDPAWDADGDAIIDSGAGPLPDYVDVNVYNVPWKGYVAAYWTDSWHQELKRKIDLAAVENFDGLMLDVMTGYWTWENTYPSMDLATLRGRMADLIKWISDYSKGQYGSAFLVTVNLDADAYQYFPDLANYVDGGYYQNAFFRWDGSAVVDGYGLSTSADEYANPSIDFVRNQGLSVLDMDHIGTGPVTPGLDFENYDDRVTDENLLLLFRWAITSRSTPFASPVFMGWSYGAVPRFTRVYADKPPLTETPYRDWVLGSPADDTIATDEGDDLVYGGPGNDMIDCGNGNDSVLYLNESADYTVAHVGGMVVVTSTTGDEGTDMLVGVEHIIFSDLTEDLE